MLSWFIWIQDAECSGVDAEFKGLLQQQVWLFFFASFLTSKNQRMYISPLGLANSEPHAWTHVTVSFLVLITWLFLNYSYFVSISSRIRLRIVVHKAHQSGCYKTIYIRMLHTLTFEIKLNHILCKKLNDLII